MFRQQIMTCISGTCTVSYTHLDVYKRQEDEYVTIKGGSYYWTSEIPYELDAHQFEELLKKAEKENDLEKKKSYIEEACELYRGEFLPQLGAEGWAVVLNVYYKNLFSNAMRALCQILKDEKDYKKLYHCAEKAAIIYPLEDWQIWQMDSLIAVSYTHLDVYKRQASNMVP